jgi:hypothetical protein
VRLAAFVGVQVREAFFHCGESMIRSDLWEPERWALIDGLPTYAETLKDHAASADSLETIRAHVDHNKARRLYQLVQSARLITAKNSH